MRRPRPSAMSLTLWFECKEARLASRTPRLLGLLEPKIFAEAGFLTASASKSDRADSTSHALTHNVATYYGG
jgi:hypothetical protein